MSGTVFENASSYLRTENPQIDICLNCKRSDCKSGLCELVSPPKNYIIKKTWYTREGIKKVSYYKGYYSGQIQMVKSVFNSLRRSKEGAEQLMSVIQQYTKNGRLEVVNRNDEIKKVSEEKHKTYRGKHRIHVDANGNILGKQC